MFNVCTDRQRDSQLLASQNLFSLPFLSNLSLSCPTKPFLSNLSLLVQPRPSCPTSPFLSNLTFLSNRTLLVQPHPSFRTTSFLSNLSLSCHCLVVSFTHFILLQINHHAHIHCLDSISVSPTYFFCSSTFLLVFWAGSSSLSAGMRTECKDYELAPPVLQLEWEQNVMTMSWLLQSVS